MSIAVRQVLIGLLCGWMAAGHGGSKSAHGIQSEPQPFGIIQRTLDSHFPFTVPDDLKEWEIRRDALRRQLQVALGLWPSISRSPLRAVEHSPIDCGDYLVSHVYFESLPGYFVTGNLYRPKAMPQRKVPGILCPHGHFSDGRFTENDEATISAMIARGEESEFTNARSPLQSRCAHLARMGCVIFHYDMIGYADSVQIPMSVAHGYRERRAEDQRRNENEDSDWAFFSPIAEMHQQSIMGLQTWNSIRAVDFLESLPEVDADRIGVTGCSGGGTQTFVLAALDPRIKAAFSAAMVSTHMQGGCTCENCCNLRVVTGNVEIAALFAPRPMGLSAANDWTKAMPTDGFPELQKLYRLYGAETSTFLAPSLTLPHGYNEIARRTMYAWFNRHLDICDDPERATVADAFAGKFSETSPYRERPIKFLSRNELTVWNDEHPAPSSGIEVERSVTRYWAVEQQRAASDLWETDSEAMKQAMRCLLNVSPGNPVDDALELATLSAEDEDASGVRVVSFELNCRRENFPFRFKTWFDRIHDGAAGGTAGDPSRCLLVLCKPMEPTEAYATLRKELLLAGHDLIEIDSSSLHLENKLVANGREAAGYTYGYNRSNLARNARAVAWAIDHFGSGRGRPIVILETDRSEPALLAGAAAAETGVHAMICKGTFSFADTAELTDPSFFPGALLLGDRAGMKRIAGLDDEHCRTMDTDRGITAAEVERLIDELSMKIP